MNRRISPRTDTDPLEVCVARLRADADVFARYGDERGSAFARAVAGEVAAALAATHV